MRFRADADFLREFIDGPTEPRVALSLDGDQLEVEVRLTFRRTAQVAGVDSGLAIVNLSDLTDALHRTESGAVEIEVLGDTIWVRSGRAELSAPCFYERERP